MNKDILEESTKCPECDSDLEQVSENDTNAVLGVYCEHCKYQKEY